MVQAATSEAIAYNLAKYERGLVCDYLLCRLPRLKPLLTVLLSMREVQCTTVSGAGCSSPAG